MKHKTIRRPDADAQRTRSHKHARAGRWPLTTLAGLMLAALTTPPAWAAVSAKTGVINGTAPYATGSLFVKNPSNTVVKNNDVMINAWAPKDFTVAADTTDLVINDDDEDCLTTVTPPVSRPCPVSIDTTKTVSVWKYDGVALTTAQLAAAFSSSFVGGSALTVAVSAPVNVTSTTGAPTTSATPTILSSSVYTVTVPGPPKLRVNGTDFTWAEASGVFPKTGFVGARFQFLMDGTGTGANGFYDFTVSNGGWLSLSPLGTVSFAATPAKSSLPAIITIKHITTGFEYKYTVNPTGMKWFTNRASGLYNFDAATATCASTVGFRLPDNVEGVGYVATGSTSVSPVGRSPGLGLYPEWGPMGSYANGWTNNGYQTATRTRVPGIAALQNLQSGLGTGATYATTPGAFNGYVFCVTTI